MSFERELQPRKDDYNPEFVREHIRRSRQKDDEENPVPDPDASFFGLAQQIKASALPEAAVTSAAIRTDPPWHGSFPALVIRHSIEFTLVFTICFGVYLHDPWLLIKLMSWCIVNSLVFGVANSIWQSDRNLSHASFAGLWWVLPLVTFLPLASNYSLIGQVVVGSLMLLFVPIAFFPGFEDVPGALFKCVMFGVMTVLVITLGPLRERVFETPAILPSLLFAANYLLVLPFGMNMQHWFAAHRYANIHDVWRYGRVAKRRDQPMSLVLKGLFAHVVILATGVGTSLLLSIAVVDVLRPTRTAYDQFKPLATIGLLGTLGVGLYIFVLQMLIVRRLPRPLSYLHSFYVTWRCLAAWLSEAPAAFGPTAFQFASPWTSVSLRRALLGVSLSIHSALAVTLLREWTLQFLLEAEAQAQAQTSGHLLWNGAYLFTVILGAIVWPPTMFFLTVHATWGATLESFSQHFELLNEAVDPPIVNRAARTA